MKIFIFKADGIGDFVLATGAIHLLAKEFGGENLTLAVLPSVAELARDQFPDSRILVLPLTAKRRTLNLFVANFLQILPAWWGLVPEKFDVVLSLRHSRKYLESFFLASLGGRRRVLSENQLSTGGHPARGSVEKILWRLRPARVLPYPLAGPEPRELLMHQMLLAEILPSASVPSALLPVLRTASPSPSQQKRPILLCPFSSMKSKDYPASAWLEIFSLLPVNLQNTPIELAGDSGQSSTLESFAGDLRRAGFTNTKVRGAEDLPAFLQALAAACLVLTVDTAAAHMACALNCPAIILFSGLHRGIYAPWATSSRQVWLEADPPAPGEPPRKKSHWFKGIAADRVARLMLQKLES